MPSLSVVPAVEEDEDEEEVAALEVSEEKILGDPAKLKRSPPTDAL